VAFLRGVLTWETPVNSSSDDVAFWNILAMNEENSVGANDVFVALGEVSYFFGVGFAPNMTATAS
jgi:hypothetical protein